MEPTFIKYKKTNLIRSILCFILLVGSHFPAAAQEVVPSDPTIFSNPFFNVLLSVIIFLLIVIIVFADLAKASIAYKKEKDKEKNNSGTTIIKTLVIFFILAGSSTPLLAQESNIPVATAASDLYMGMDIVTFYTMIGIIAFELLIIWMLRKVSMQLFGVEERKRKEAEQKAKSGVKQPTFIEIINDSKAIEEEEDIMLDHNYDGIRELDNNLPPWWKYGFYLTIVIAVVYMVHFHVLKTGKLQLAEYEEEIAKGKADVEEYRKKAANLIDENNATLLTDAASLNSGKAIFMDNCAACHGRAGEGGVGPNLTDNFWIHKGGIKDIFKTIKYGYPEKGMKSWQQDLGAKQIHEVSSYIKSLTGSNPPNPKEKQGELYTEGNVSDSTLVAGVDSLAINNDSLKADLKEK